MNRRYYVRRAGAIAVAAGLIGTTLVVSQPEEASAAKKICVESIRRTGAIVHGTNSGGSPATPTGAAVVDQVGNGRTCGSIAGSNCTGFVPPRTSMTWHQSIPFAPDQYGYFNNTGTKGYEKLLEKGSDCSLGTFKITFVAV